MESLFDKRKKTLPFGSYEEYMEYLFTCVNEGMNRYLTGLKQVYSLGEGGYKNVLYPDLEIAHDVCLEKLGRFQSEETAPMEEEHEALDSGEKDDLMDLEGLFSEFVMETTQPEVETEDIAELMDYINARAKLAKEAGVSLPFYEICEKLNYENFTVFCLTCGILSSTQTDYAGVFQVINENGSLPMPTIESADRKSVV